MACLIATSLSLGAAFPLLALAEQNNEIRACVDKVDGRVRIVTDLSKCAGIEEPITWNKQGVPGPQGEPGAIGSHGPQGPRGPQGIAGQPGAAGEPGVAGERGEVGPIGPSGPAGPRGLQGVAGSAGARGPTGPAGIQGLRGPSGPKGDTGPAGPSGQTVVQAAGGNTPFTYTGPSSTSIVPSVGIIAMNQICAYTYEQSRMCDTRELIETPGKISTPTESMWIRPHVVGNQGGLVIDYSGMAQVVDNMTCAGPSSMGEEAGTMPWISNAKTATGLIFNITHIDYGACHVERAVACCSATPQ